MIQKVSNYQFPVNFVIKIDPDKNSPVSPDKVVINEKKYLNLQKIEDIKNEAAIRIKNCIFDAIVKTEAEIQLRKMFYDDQQTMPISNELMDWFLSNSEEILIRLEKDQGGING